MYKKMIVSCLSLALLSGCSAFTKPKYEPMFLSIDGGGVPGKNIWIPIHGSGLYVYDSCPLYGKAGVVIDTKYYECTTQLKGKPVGVRGAFNLSQYAEECGALAGKYIKDGSPAVFTPFGTNFGKPTEKLEGTLLIQDTVKPKYAVICDFTTVKVYQRTTTIPDGPQKDQLLKASEMFAK
ncbi:hypothetical protein GJV07_02085 [Enterobacteriaceae bacterium RIT711]|nr:hypothetical protein [Enterobacteriaceae bacterium RIT711]